MLLSNDYVINDIKEEIKRYLEMNENTMTENSWDTVKAVLSGKFIAIQVYLKKQQQKISNKRSNLQSKELEKEQQTNPKVNRRKEIIKISVKTNEIEPRKRILMKPRVSSLKG